MKLEIYYKSHLLKSTLNSPITIKELILNIKSSIKSLKSTQNFLIFNNQFEILSEDEKIIPSEKNPFQLFLIDIEPEKKTIEKKSIEIEELIMKVTGAEKKLESNNIKLPPPNLYENNPNLNRLLQLLQALEQRNIIIEGNENNNVPIEVNESYLNELKDMGFPEDRARTALIRSRNNMNRATEILLDEGE